ncbi:MAG: right-handed parallel beta-helix repeat-containing protein, partial [Anaerolineae bacterium]|nr:right-handed parallel beta-helix repeat-containing protein [Anaerolineae bacterium]
MHTPIKFRHLRAIWIAAVLTIGLCSCQKDDDPSPPVRVTGYQNNTLTVPANSVVEIEGNLEFNPDLNPGLVLEGNATFKLDQSMSMTWPASFVKPANAHVTITSRIPGQQWYRLLLPATSSITLENFTLEDGQIGVYSDGANNLDLTGFSISNCSQYGVYITNADTLRIDDFQIDNCLDYGIQTKFSTVFISNTTIANCFQGITTTDCTIQIHDSWFNDNTSSGVHLDGALSNAIIEYCSFENRWYALYNYSNRHLRFRKNQILHQNDYAVYIPRAHTSEILFEQNNVMPGGSQNNRMVLIRDGLYEGGERYLIAGNNWWGTTDTTVIR